jgi:2-hydroxy-3-keto-5-methylthiopentenyl-1-phosphate phosphatase
MNSSKYKAVVSSDWSECLSPNGPFDPIKFNFPTLEDKLNRIFKEYTGNRVSLTYATTLIRELLPEPLTEEHMDAYLDASFQTYTGVADLIEWCLRHDILFMINTTGTQGYFQRVFAKQLFPSVPVVAANPLIRFPDGASEDRYHNQVLEIEDKPKSTIEVLRTYGLPSDKVVVMGDSGGDGPHFQWAAENGAFRIGSMAKHSLIHYCESRNIRISRLFGLCYGADEARDPEKEMHFNFRELKIVLCDALDLQT